MAHSPQKRAAARRAFEQDGESLNSIARRMGISRNAVSRWRNDEGWVELEDADPSAVLESAAPVTDDEPEVEPEVEADEVIVAPAHMSVEDELRAELEEARRRLQQYEPTKVAWPEDEETARLLLRDELDSLVQNQIVELNRQRLRTGFPPIQASELGEEWVEQTKDQIIAETVDNLTRWAGDKDPATRTLAMLKPDGVTRVKVPLQENIGNYGLSPDAYLSRLKAKGFVELTPARCWRQDCWAEGSQQYEGYCSEMHLLLDPYRDVDPSKNLATTTTTFEM